ncbi:B3 domain-containing protein At5g42700 [Mangifera indica]|uniref:B3 domain-containing protein At5g42700 n=1 Tax=Mangifera indica TaxID=29780 RepID=UPI001CF9AFF8|nr:B3 domain-containing protein At5g42700 [Mangifera indica]
MVMGKPSYEEYRLKRLEENKKRMEALNLPRLSQALRKTPSNSLKPSPMKKVKLRTAQKQMEMVVVRRSSRVANKTAPVYSDVDPVRVAIPRRVFKSRDLSNRVYASDEARAAAIEKAEKLESSLESDYPIFIKSMLQSHVTGGFWLGLPVYFCKENLPKRDEVITLIDEDDNEYPTIYLARKTGLSGGWKGFAVAHNLVDGDALIFQLVQRTTFKVYIIRVNGSEQRKNLPLPSSES